MFLKIYLNALNDELNLKYVLLHNKLTKIPDNGDFQVSMRDGLLIMGNRNIISTPNKLNLIVEIIENIEINDTTIPFLKE